MIDDDELGTALMEQAQDTAVLPLRAYRVAIDAGFDLDNQQVVITSWGLTGFRVADRDIFTLLDRLPTEIATWFQQRYGVEVVVVPVHSTHKPSERTVTDGYIVMTVRAMLAEARRLQ